jgi:hypothetical protein
MRPGPDVISDGDNSRLGLSIPGSRDSSGLIQISTGIVWLPIRKSIRPKKAGPALTGLIRTQPAGTQRVIDGVRPEGPAGETFC